MVELVRTVIFYFTGTGNSLMIAKSISSQIQESKLIRISQFLDISDEDDCLRVGLIFPVYYGGLPSLVRELLPALKIFQDGYFFAVSTYASGPGRALAQLRAELQSIGLELSAGFSLRMPQNFIMSYDVPDDKKVTTIIDRMQERLPAIVETIRTMKLHRPESNFQFYSGQSQRYHDFIARVKKTDTSFWCDDRCTGCRICVLICPVQNVVLDNTRPQWLHNCEQCLACFNWCPNEAIQCGNNTSEKGRYTNPLITIEEMKL